MIAQRVGVAALRRGAKPGLLLNQNMQKLALASHVSAMQSRAVGTTKVSNEDGREILANQRLNRPIAPHLGVYKMEQTWFSASAWTRITGCTLSGAAYVYFVSYLIAPLAGLHLESASLATAFAGLPFLAKGGIKFLLGFPFAYHFINGVKHLIYDMGKGFSKPAIKKGEMLLWTSSIVSGLYLAFGL